MTGSALYVGTVMHQRLRAPRHRLAYRVFSLLLDIDELPHLDRRLRCWSFGRFNLFGFDARDHGDGSGQDLRLQIDAQQRSAGLPTGGRVRLLAMPRVLGHGFNPLSVWFCDAPDGHLQAIVYEVHNTFRERHSYLIPVASPTTDAAPTILTQRCDKRMFVSPFLDMDLHYRFRIEPPQDAARGGLSIGVGVHAADGTAVLHARLDAHRQPLTDATLLRAFATHPLLTLQVVAGIHWEALKLWVKGARLHTRPPAPSHGSTIVPPQETP